jgi:hypothetical protein
LSFAGSTTHGWAWSYDRTYRRLVLPVGPTVAYGRGVPVEELFA